MTIEYERVKHTSGAVICRLVPGSTTEEQEVISHLTGSSNNWWMSFKHERVQIIAKLHGVKLVEIGGEG